MKTNIKHIKNTIASALFAIALSLAFASCGYLDGVYPDDRIAEEDFWTEPKDAEMALNGVYQVIRNTNVYGYGGGMDACTPNAYQWAHWEGKQMQIGDGSINSSSEGLVDDRWKFCYDGIRGANYFLANVDRIPNLDPTKKKVMLGEIYFLRGLFYDLLARTYGGIPIIKEPISIPEALKLTRASLEDTWAQVHADFDEAIARLPINAEANGHATLGSAYGLKMKAYLYTSQWDKVLEYCDKIDGLNKYKLYPSYYGLFQVENKGNTETLFAVSFMAGSFEQGSVFDRYWQPQNLKYNINGSNSVAPTQLLVDEYETLDGSPIDPANPYNNRDPRLDLTVLRPGAKFQGQLYPTEIKNHTGQKVGFGIRKYTIENMAIVANQSPLDFMVLRYGDVLLCRAEALIEYEPVRDIPAAMALVDRIRTERTDVQMPTVAATVGSDLVAARKALRHERRIELALEGQFWDDIKRWNAGPEFYPCKVVGGENQDVQTKFPNGYDIQKDNLLPIPDKERSMNKNLIQNPGY